MQYNFMFSGENKPDLTSSKFNVIIQLDLSYAERSRYFMKKKILCLLLTVLLLCGMTQVFASSFYDVPDDFWAQPYIENLAARGIISGYGDGTFLPHNYVQRCEYAKMLVNSAGVPLSSARTSPYADVDVNGWEMPYINSVTKFLSGYQSSTPGDERIYFKPFDYATREDVAVALMKALGYTYDELLQKYGDTQYLLSDTFYDYDAIARQDRPFIAEAVSLGYITGTQEGTFEPSNPITRCEVCAVLWRAFPGENLNYNEVSEAPGDIQPGASLNILKVFYLDVGQGDSEFIELPNGETMLIDAGTNEYGSYISDFIKSKGYSKIDYLVATHPHADHIGGMTEIINSFDIGTVYLPNAQTNTKTYENFLTAILDKSIPAIQTKSGTEILSADNLKVSALAPNSDEYKELNNYSIVLKLTYGNTSFLFMGDAEDVSEDEIINAYPPKYIDSDVIKIGHHGSSTSSTTEFINTVSPQYAIISCGAGNKYGHPNEKTLETLCEITVFRTDTDGTICITSDGNSIYKQ